MTAQITRSDIEKLDMSEPDVPRDVVHDFKRVPVDMFSKERDRVDELKSRFGLSSRRDAIRACVNFVYENS